MAQNTKDYETLYVVSVCCFFTSLGQHILAGGEIRPGLQEQHCALPAEARPQDNPAVGKYGQITIDCAETDIRIITAQIIVNHIRARMVTARAQV